MEYGNRSLSVVHSRANELTACVRADTASLAYCMCYWYIRCLERSRVDFIQECCDQWYTRMSTTTAYIQTDIPNLTFEMHQRIGDVRTQNEPLLFQLTRHV